MKVSENPDVILEVLEVSPFLENTYVFGKKSTKECVIIDPGDEPDRILRTVNFLGLTVKYILLTHGHLDHVAGCGKVRKETGARVGIHRLDEEMFVNASRQGYILGFPAQDQDPPDFYLEDGDVVTLGDLDISVIHTPGHTRGGVCFLCGDVLFSGDLLFAGSIGRTDLPGGSYETLIRSVVERVFTLPDETLVFPGHGPRTSVGVEKRYNPFFA
ncbi:MAG: MBL fold metallo-hydrolase [Deltaproteobacteria bacterium]|nr:MAG: MBL fold metallo-hydrolase [Deltaproteobacteria bacterium]